MPMESKLMKLPTVVIDSIVLSMLSRALFFTATLGGRFIISILWVEKTEAEGSSESCPRLCSPAAQGEDWDGGGLTRVGWAPPRLSSVRHPKVPHSPGEEDWSPSARREMTCFWKSAFS